ncbi:L-threonylcarbamoyladenylate synthase [Nocardioides sp. DS6]|uniref:L-threonylcarbamoyladenylate synthase n=1 Tax=Nocardioides eburneus TaxID=3231482 RepID=A0ABV3T188_9ACTN
MSTRYPTATDEERAEAIDAAAKALQRGDVVVLPTDTVYGVAADAFDKGAVQALLDAKGRGREKPPPVLVANAATLDALATRVPDWARTLVDELWPGALTLVFHQQPSLQWDLGETRSTVAVRMPDLALTREVIDRVGPLAVSSANKTGMPPATDADRAESMLADDVALVLDAGTAPGGEPSTIIDATGETPRLLRLGAIPVERINALLAKHDVQLPVEGQVDLTKPEGGEA